MTSRYQHPHLKIEIILPIEDGVIAEGQVIQLKDLQDAFETITNKLNTRKGSLNA